MGKTSTLCDCSDQGGGMTAVIIPVPQGISIEEQKCYLEYQGDNKAIINCLNDKQANDGVGVLILFGIVALAFYFLLR
jgi:hypothetical protein